MAKLAGHSNVNAQKTNDFLNKLKGVDTSKPKKKTSSPVERLKQKIEEPKIEEEKINVIETTEEIIEVQEEKTEEKKNKKKPANDYDISFVELKELFGPGFSECEYREMYSKYVSLQNNYPLRTEMHKEALITYVKYAYKRDMAIANDDMDAADKWGKLAAKQATDAKINPSQLSAADLSDGISNFSKIAEAVEREQDIIPLLPHFKQRPQDVVDYTLWQYVNYIRRLQNLPEVKYADLYKFVDEAYEKNKNDLPFISKPIDGKYDEVQ